jgi:hypothetical protein
VTGGNKILVIWDGSGTIRRARLRGRVGSGTRWQYDIPQDARDLGRTYGSGMIDETDEGTTWIRGWGAEAEGALRAGWTLADPEPTLIDVKTATGRTQSAHANVSNMPRAR